MPTEPTDLSALRLDVLRRAIALYLAAAYEGGDPPAAVRRRLDWPEGAEPSTLLAGPPFERATPRDHDGPPIYALRLGNARYPHMKLQLQPWPNADGFLLSVNTHDQILGLGPAAQDADGYRALQADNQRFKERIEEAWDEEKLPTFLRYLRDYLVAQTPPDRG